MQTIRDLLSRDLSQPIEEVIKLDQQDEKVVYTEITEYVATDRLKRQYQEVLEAIAAGPGEPSEQVGVWISGFFGSGKSSFAKILGYVLANRPVLGQPAGQLFIRQLEQQSPGDPLVKRIADLVEFINNRFQAHVIMFDVQVDRAVRKVTQPIAEIMYTVLLRELDYAQDYDIADLEIDLEAEGRLAEFVRTCASMYGEHIEKAVPARPLPPTLAGVDPKDYAVWQQVRKGAERIQRASAILHRMDPATYPAPDSWAASLRGSSDITIRTLVDRTFELMARRRPGHAAIFIIDEVGQYVARSVDKIENLRAVVEHFGQESKKRVVAGKAVAPVWVIVTSQEKLDEVVAAIDDKRVELAKLQDRFSLRIDMAPSDIREVATRRVLAKKPEAERFLQQRFDAAAARLRTHTRLERTSRKSEVDRAEFVQFYPYLPHFIDLSIDIVSGIRLQPGAPRHIGGSNRTIIKQAYEMLVSDRTRLADAPVGTLVTLDRIYDLVEGNLSSEKQRDIGEIAQRWPNDPWPVRTAKAIALLEYVRDLPRTEANLAALLYDHLDGSSPLPEVQRAVELLEKADFIRQTENGWKLQTAQEKNWATERNALNPTPRERNEILENRLQSIFEEPALSRYPYKKICNFRVGVTWDGRAITSGEAQVPLILRIADGPDVFQATCDQAREDSRSKPHFNDIFWCMHLTDELDEAVVEVYRSRQMVAKYDQLRAQGKITNEESASLAAEKSEALRWEQRLTELLKGALAAGRGYFRGVSKEGSQLGKTLNEVLHALFGYAVPQLYPKLEMGAKTLKGGEAEEILKAANLAGLSKVFYDPPDGLQLVVKEGNRYVVNLNAPIIKEVMAYLTGESSYGNKVTGRSLEGHFGGIGYGWKQEILWLVLATMLRGGAIEVTYQGRRFRDHLDPQVRVAFSGTNAFRAASFAPRKVIDLRTLVAAAKRYEELTGEEVDVEESAIAQAFQRLARTELADLLQLEATVRAYNIPLMPVLQEYRATLETILNSASDDCVNMLVSEGTTFQAARARIAAIRKATDKKGLERLQRLRTAVYQAWPLLQAAGRAGDLAGQVETVRRRLEDGSFYEVPTEMERILEALEASYYDLYKEQHDQRRDAFGRAMDEIKALPNWAELSPEIQASILKPFSERADHELSLLAGELSCTACHATLAEMAADLAAVEPLRSDAVLRVQQLTAPEERIERVRVAEVTGFGQPLSTAEDVEEMLEQLREHLLKLILAGIKVLLE